MRIRTGIATVFLVATVAACTTAPPGADVDDSVSVSPSPIGAVDRAQNVADQVEQRQAELEAQLNDPFQQP